MVYRKTQPHTLLKGGLRYDRIKLITEAKGRVVAKDFIFDAAPPILLFILVITWLGEYALRLEKGDLAILFDPPSSASKLKVPRNGTSLLVLSGSSDFKDFGHFEKSFLITGPGEYDIRGVFTRGISLPQTSRTKQNLTMYVVEFDSMNTLFLPAFVPVPLPDDLLEDVGDVDILAVPVGGKGVCLEGDAAEKLVRQIEPRLVIPINFHIPGIGVKLDKLDTFLKHMGIKSPDALPKLTIKQKELPQEETKVVVLKPS